MDDTKSLVPELSNADGTFPETDISPENANKIQVWVDEGKLGVLDVDDKKLEKMVDLYLSGKTYSQISQICKVNKTIVMYFAQKGKWCEIRGDYLVELSENMKRRVLEARLESQDFMLNLAQMYQKRIGKKVNRYLSSDLEEAADQINLKEIDKYLKIIETLRSNMEEPKNQNQSTIGLNLGEGGATITRKGDNEIEITPKQKATGDILKHYADMRRKEEGNR